VQKPYRMEEHQHRFAVWAAGRAVQRGVGGLSGKICKDILEGCGLTACFGLSSLAGTAIGFDKQHRKLCKSIIREAGKRKAKLTHGQAAKLLNVYFKVRFVLDSANNDDRIKVIHPPIDRTLLAKLAEGECLELGRYKNWTQFSFNRYQGLIDTLRNHFDNKPFWMIEAYWPGHQ
jgi:hypothetical protein